jgi:peptidoglycan/xylan/chitin deacetylase (PgdA/CDA1 family)
MTPAADAIVAGRGGGAFDATYYQYERYARTRERARARSLYYTVKPLIPRRVQLGMRRAYARRQATRQFPAWPIEPVLVEHHLEELRAAIADSPDGRVPIVGLWPAGHRAASVLTHDVEDAPGVENIERVREVERRYGFVSSWNFVAETYEIPANTFDRLRAEGCEVGLHGIKHDGKLFRSRATFEANLPLIHAYLEEWGAVGFRSPATHRRADPFEPQAGGCCSILPFLLDGIVELPITLVQDHTLWEILRQPSIELWTRKSDWIIDNNGLVNIITHPDYLRSEERLAMYDQYLRFLAGKRDIWHALPRDVARWWKARTQMRCERAPEGARIVNDLYGRAQAVWACERGDEIVFDG